MSLEDVEESRNEVLTSTLVGKVIYSKVLNKWIVKNILVKAWGEPQTLTISDLGPNFSCSISLLRKP